jgi:hypothetical protein
MGAAKKNLRGTLRMQPPSFLLRRGNLGKARSVIGVGMPVVELRTIVVVTAAVLLAGCSVVQQPERPTGLVIEPRANLDAGSGCTSQLGVAKVNALFAAINRSDAEAAAAMFPREGEGLVRQPEFEFDELNLKATAPDEVASVVRQLAGMHFVFTAPLPANAQKFDYYLEANQKVSVWAVAVGPVLWKTTSGGRSYSGGGKITFNCESGKFTEVVF